MKVFKNKSLTELQPKTAKQLEKNRTNYAQEKENHDQS